MVKTFASEKFWGRLGTSEEKKGKELALVWDKLSRNELTKKVSNKTLWKDQVLKKLFKIFEL